MGETEEYNLFEHMSQEHGLTLLETELEDIIAFADKVLKGRITARDSENSRLLQQGTRVSNERNRLQGALRGLIDAWSNWRGGSDMQSIVDGCSLILGNTIDGAPGNGLIYVVAGSDIEFQHYCSRLGLKHPQVRRIMQPDHLRGVHGKKIIKLGHWGHNEELAEAVTRYERMEGLINDKKG